MNVFVYGTLKTGEPNHNWLTNAENGQAKLVGVGRTSKSFPLVEVPLSSHCNKRFKIPFLLNKVGVGKKVLGEVYSIDKHMLDNLDKLEKYPEIYTRREVEIQMMDETDSRFNSTGTAWIYLLNNFQDGLLALPFVECYNAGDNHNLPKELGPHEIKAILDLVIDRNKAD